VNRLFITAVLVVPLAILFALPLMIGFTNYILFFMYLTFLIVIISLAWDLAGGLAGLVSLGNTAFFGMGAYTTAILVKAGFNLFLAILAAGLLAIGIGTVLSVAIRLRGVYFVISTLYLAFIIQILMLNWTPVTGGAAGLFLPIPTHFNYLLPYYISMVVMITIITSYYLLKKSRVGLAFRAIGSDEGTARSIGINVVLYKVLALLFSAFFTGIMGGLYVSVALFVDPNSAFSINWSLYPTFGAIIGGMGTIWGAVIGGVIIALLTQLLAPLGSYNTIIESALLVAVILIMPVGIYGGMVGLFRRNKRPSPKQVTIKDELQLGLRKMAASHRTEESKD